MDLEVLGRHALLFDDDATAAFVNSSDALVEWNSLLIDRYDVRHLLQHPPPPLKRRRHHPSSPNSSQTELDQERYLDLPPSSDDHDSSSLLESDNGAERAVDGGFHSVAFSYGYPDISADQKNTAAGLGDSGFLPPFPVPESLLQSLPPSEKVHQIIARTAMFVSKHGGQSEIVLRVKQGDNPTFGFLMPDHHLHAYYRFLVDNVELLNSSAVANPADEKKEGSTKNPTSDVDGGALSLLGSVYGSGEDEESALQGLSDSKEKEPGEILDTDNATVSRGSECAESSVGLPGKIGGALKPPLHAAKEKSVLSKRSRSVAADNADVTCKKREGDGRVSSGVSMEKLQVSSLPTASNVEHLIIEPPSHLKRMVDKIVEFILKNGKEFEAVLIEQDSKNGRFPFLLPSDQYHPYYLKALQKAQESKLPGKSSSVPNNDKMGNVGVKKGSLSKDENDALSRGSSVSDIPFESERKEKFKMVIGGSKKEAQDPLPKSKQQCGMSVDAAAAILQAATRGRRNILPKTVVDDSSLGISGEAGPASSYGSLSSSLGRSSTQKPIPNGEPSYAVPIELSRSADLSEKEIFRSSGVSVGKVIAKTAALAAAGEADSAEASLTKEQKMKAERLKRAKMFAAMIKSGTAPLGNDVLPCAAEPPDPGCKALQLNNETLAPETSKLSGGEVDLLGREREGSSVPVDANTSDRSKSDRHDSDDDYKERKSDRHDSDDDYKERKSRRKYRSRSRMVEESDNDSDVKDHKHHHKKHRSHRSSHHKDDSKHRKRHSSPDHKESRRRHKHHGSSDDEHKHRRRSEKHRSRSKREVEPDNDIDTEISAQTNTPRVSDNVTQAANGSQEVSNPLATGSLPSDTTEVSDDLRAKVRAMLLATM